MRRKFLYFKIFDLKEHPKEVEALSFLEISNIVGVVTPIENIFQLTQQPEVKRIIENDLNLQNALTDSLPGRGRHGYLWVGDVLPDIVNFLSRLSYIKEIFLFQQLLEPEPDFLKQKNKNMTFLEYNIHLWRVYKFWSFSYFLNRGRYITALCKTQSELDEKYKIFREELHIVPSKLAGTDPGDLLSYVGNDTLASYNIDNRSSGKSLKENKHINALINSIPEVDDAVILNSFSDNGDVLKEGTLFGYNVYGQELNPVDRIFAEINSSLFLIDLVEFNRLIPEVQSKLKMLMTASIATQTDLFLYSVEGQFLNFWETEKKRIKSLDLPDSIAEIGKFIGAIRFLIETKSVTKEAVYNKIFLAILINMISQSTRRKEVVDFYAEYQDALIDFYLKLYSFNKIKSFFNQDFGSLKIGAENSVTSFDAESKIAGVIAYLPVRINKKGFEKDHHIINVLNMHSSIDKTEHQLVGSRYISSKDKEDLTEQIKSHTGFYEKLPKEAADLLARLELMGKQDDVLRYIYLWKQYQMYFKTVFDALGDHGRFILIFDQVKIKIDKTEIEVPLEKIICGLMESGGLLFKHVTSIARNNYATRLSEKSVYTILILDKEK